MLHFRKKHIRTSAQKLSSCYVDLTSFSMTIHKVLPRNSNFCRQFNFTLKKLVKSVQDEKLCANWKEISSTDSPLIKRQGMYLQVYIQLQKSFRTIVTIRSNTKSRKNITRKFVTWTYSIGAVIKFSVNIKLTKVFKFSHTN